MKKAMTTLVLLFFAMVMIFQKESPVEMELQFVRNMDEVFMHNAPDTQREYLFEDEWGQQTYQGEMATWSTSTPTTDSLETLVNPDEVEQISWEIQGWKIYSGTFGTGTKISQKPITIYTGSLDCITPWREQVKNQDFVLAYEQRKDVNTICNVEKRVCMSGTLWWSFTQDSCKDDITYKYHKAEIISYNQKMINEYIQPKKMTMEEEKAYSELIQPTAPVNVWAEFTTEGKINTPEAPATTTRDTTNAPVTTQAEVEQTEAAGKRSCTTPRGQKIKNGQFIKAYKAPRWFIDLPCDVQLRPCIDGTLKWMYTYPTCKVYNTTYTEYLKAWSPTSNTWFLLFERIKSVLRRNR